MLGKVPSESGCDSVGSRATGFLCGQRHTPREFGEFSRGLSWSTTGKLACHFLACAIRGWARRDSLWGAPAPILAAWCPRRFWSLPHGAGLPRAASGSLPDEDTRETVACASLSLKQSSGGQSVPYGEVHRQGTEAPISETSSPQLGLLVTAIPSWHHCDHRETLKP